MCPKCPKYDIKKIKNSITSNDPRIIKIKQDVYSLILKKTVRALKRLDIPVFLSSGTCLGYFREGKFIDYDYDIDVGIWATDYTPKIAYEMKKENLILYRVLGKPREGLELSFRMPNTPLGKHAKIDIFLHYKEKHEEGNKVAWYTYASPAFVKKVKYRVSDFDIEKVKFAGTEVFVPSPTLKYIEEHYGEDWMIPKKPFTEYTYHSSPKSIVRDE